MCIGGNSGSTSQSAASNATTVNVSTQNNIDTKDLADALQALGQASIAGAYVSAREQAIGNVAAAAISAKAGPSWSTMLIVAAAVLGLLFTAGAIKLPHSLRA